jgi:hypothetical protein
MTFQIRRALSHRLDRRSVPARTCAFRLALLTLTSAIVHCSSAPSSPTEVPIDTSANDGAPQAPGDVDGGNVDGGKSEGEASAPAQACASAIDVSAHLTNGKAFRGATSTSSGGDVDCGLAGDPTQYLVLVAPAAGNYAFSVKPVASGPSDPDAVVFVGDACGGGAESICQDRIAFLSGYVSFRAAKEKVYLVAKGKALAAGYDLTFQSRGPCSDDSQCRITPKPVCETATGACVGCSATKDCTAGKQCDTSRRLCVECLTSTDCRGSTGLTCDTAAGRCTCKGPSDCPLGLPVCVQGPPSSCVECSKNADCTGPRTRGSVCGPASTCDCTGQPDCAPSALGTACGMHHGSRSRPSCGCWTSFDCPSSTPICLLSSHECGAGTCTLVDDVYDDVDDGPLGATVINVAVGDSVTQAHQLCSARDEEDWIRIPALAGDKVSVRVDFTDPNAAASITLSPFNEQGRSIGSNPASGSSPRTLNLGPKSTDGAYFVQITGDFFPTGAPQYLRPYTLSVARSR